MSSPDHTTLEPDVHRLMSNISTALRANNEASKEEILSSIHLSSVGDSHVETLLDLIAVDGNDIAPHVKALHIQDHRATTFLPHLHRLVDYLPKVETLRIYGVRFSGLADRASFIESYQRLPISSLSLENCEIHADTFFKLLQLPSLKVLKLDTVRIVEYERRAEDDTLCAPEEQQWIDSPNLSIPQHEYDDVSGPGIRFMKALCRYLQNGSPLRDSESAPPPELFQEGQANADPNAIPFYRWSVFLGMKEMPILVYPVYMVPLRYKPVNFDGSDAGATSVVLHDSLANMELEELTLHIEHRTDYALGDFFCSSTYAPKRLKRLGLTGNFDCTPEMAQIVHTLLDRTKGTLESFSLGDVNPSKYLVYRLPHRVLHASLALTIASKPLEIAHLREVKFTVSVHKWIASRGLEWVCSTLHALSLANNPQTRSVHLDIHLLELKVDYMEPLPDEPDMRWGLLDRTLTQLGENVSLSMSVSCLTCTEAQSEDEKMLWNVFLQESLPLACKVATI